MVTEYYSASQAAEDVKNARDLDGDYMKKETITVLGTIESYALRGLSTKSFSNLDEIILLRLKKLGYTCNSYEGTQRDPSYHEISW